MLSSRGLCGTSTVKSRDKCYRAPLHLNTAPILRLASMKALKESTLSGGPNNNNNAQLPEYIVDPSTRTTYLKGKFLGKGGFARVHELTDLTTNKVYAGKIIPKSRITKPYHKEKIVREIELHRTLKHEHVVGFHHFFEDEENVYIILENCSRKSLVHILKYRRTLTEPEVRYYLHQLVSGVQYVHNQHVIHRDLKLGNMFLTEDLVMKIGDFGLATRLEQGGQKKITICGTPNYIAPEVLNKQGHSYSADIWAVGCIMYAMLVGQPPFETTTLKETYARITSNRYTIPPLISSSARSLITALLQAEPVDRPCLDAILVHEFFTNGYMPLSLPVSSCTVPPKFPPTALITRSATVSPEPLHQTSLTHELRKLTRTVSQLCLSGSKSESKVVTLREKASKVRSAKKDASLQNTLRQKISNVLCSEKSKKLKPLTATVLYQLLSTCLDAMPEDPASCPTVSPIVPILFVSKWIDYSNKYGFGFQLSDRSIGVLFNDNTKMSYTADRGRVEFHDADGRVTMHSTTSIPAALQDHNTLLKYFSKYMDENLTEGGCLKPPEASKRSGPVPHMQRWVRTTKAIVMQLSTGTIQVNFFSDHTKVVVSEEGQECYVTYIDENRQSSTYRLLQLLQGGCPTILHQRLLYVVGMLRDFSQLESTEV